MGNADSQAPAKSAESKTKGGPYNICILTGSPRGSDVCSRTQGTILQHSQGHVDTWAAALLACRGQPEASTWSELRTGDFGHKSKENGSTSENWLHL